MTNAELCKQRIDRADLDTGLATGVAQIRRTDMVFTVRLKQRQSGEAFDDLGGCLGAGKALQELLEDKAGGNDDV